jgi:hypothetical protein
MNSTNNGVVTESRAYEALRLAQTWAEKTIKPMKTSAQSCAKDAEACFNKGDFESALRRAKDSLAYSVGVFHPHYVQA